MRYVILISTTRKGKKMTKTYREDAVNIKRTATGFSVKNINGVTIDFKRLKDARRYIASNWSIALIEAQF